MQVNIAGLRRAAKNVAHNYTDPQKKVREATSNDPWGPSSTLMSEISDLTYNIEAFAQIMEMLWKRLNDHGKNWRHVYKSLVLIEYLIKTGSERVAVQCKENIFAIQTLKDFQHLEDNKDQGLNVREKAKQLVALLSSDEKLRNERTRAIKARERLAQTVSGFGSSDSNETTPTSPVFSSHSAFGHHAGDQRSRSNPELEQARPQTVGEEELQLQLALAMSKEEAEQEEKRRRNDELRLQMALSQSEQEFKTQPPPPKTEPKSALVDLLDVDLSGGAVAALPPPIMGATGIDPLWGVKQNNVGRSGDAWSAPASGITSPHDPWAPANQGHLNDADPWAPKKNVPVADPWSTSGIGNGATGNGDPLEDEFDIISRRTTDTTTATPFVMSPLTQTLESSSVGGVGKKMNPVEFLGENSNLVNLDNLLPPTKPVSPVFFGGAGGGVGTGGGSQPNPFGGASLLSAPIGGNGSQQQQVVNPFQTVIQKPSINEIREKQLQGMAPPPPSTNNVFGQNQSPQPLPPQNNPWSPVKAENPFFN